MSSRRYVYVVEAVDITAVKIGFSKNPEKRLEALQQGNPLNLKLVFKVHTKHAPALEHEAHKKLNYAKIRSEWFAVDVDHAVSVIKACLKSYYNLDYEIKKDLASLREEYGWT